jgi:hypothetical protein
VLFLIGWSSMITASDTMAANSDASGSLIIDETQVMLLIGGSYGKGVLSVGGKSYPFKIDGMKVGGLGVHKLHITGYVYHLKNIADFEGGYFSAEAAITVIKGKGGFWMKNANGVTIHIKVDGDGAALGLGLEGVTITLLK